MKHHRTRVLIIQPAMPLLYSPASSHPPCSPSSPLPPPPFRRSLPDSEPACSPHCLACGPWRRVRSRRRRQRWTRWKEPPLLSTPSRCDWAICMQLSSALTGASLGTLFVPPRLTSDTGEQSHLPSQADFPPSIFPAPPPPFFPGDPGHAGAARDRAPHRARAGARPGLTAAPAVYLQQVRGGE